MMIVLMYSVVEHDLSILVIMIMLSGFWSASHMVSIGCLGIGLLTGLVKKGLTGLWGVK